LPIPPGQPGEQAQQQRTEADVPVAAERDHRQTGHPEPDPRYLRRTGPLAQRHRRDHDGEHHLRLQHQRGQAWRHPGVHGDVEQPELPQAHERPHRGQHPPRCQRTRHQQAGREGDQQEPDGREQQRRHAAHPPVDHHEVEAPQHGDQGGEEGIAAGMCAIVGAEDDEAPANRSARD
jgi:hypothetical protein